MPLTDTKIRSAQPRERPYKLGDGGGLYLLVHPSGGKYWRQKYRIHGREKTLAHGVYPEISLKAARNLRDKARSLLADGLDPQSEKKRSHSTAANTFGAVALEWLGKQSATWKPSHTRVVKRRLERDLIPWLGPRPISDISPPELLAALNRIESRGAHETAHRIRQYCGQIFRYGIAKGITNHDIAADLRGALTPTKVAHLPTITDPKGVASLMRAIDGYSGQFVTKCALRVAPLLFVRPGELRNAEWHEISLTKAEWKIPAEKMKMGRPHLVPLSTQAKAILEELHPLTSSGKFVFPSNRTSLRPMSENTLTAALRRLGYASGEMTVHGFRSMASTILNEQGWNRDAIERQLAHVERNEVRASYNHAEYLPERRKMMQHWANFLDELKSSPIEAPAEQ